MVTTRAGIAVECSVGHCNPLFNLIDTTRARAALGKSVNNPSMERFIIRSVIIVKLYDIVWHCRKWRLGLVHYQRLLKILRARLINV